MKINKSNESTDAMKHKLLITAIAILLIHVSVSAQYLRRDGKNIVDGNGNEFILRGMGLGGWMLQEGYMLQTNAFANPQHQIRAKIVDVIGEANTVEFYEAWYANHATKRDIDSLAAWGFNSVRLPMHYNLYTLPIEEEPVAGENTWLDKGFAMTDSLLKWCEANQMYLILDLHAAPGGQGKDAAISDYDTSKPSLWDSEANKAKTVALWKKLAERYANEEWIGGYDIINEPNWAFDGTNQNGCDEQTNAPLRALYIRITDAIREVDNNHIIYIEGNCWGNNHNGLLPFWDDNMVLSFHKYWNYTDQNSIQGMIDKRNQYNVPLWLGETGENSNVWFRNTIALLEANKIGWAWWPMKKVGSVVNPLTIVKNPGYDELLRYWGGQGTKPSVADAKAALMQLAENLKIENNVFRPDVIDAMFRQVHEDTTIPYTHHVAPGVVHASNYDLGRYNKAYVDTDTATYHVSGGEYTAWNSGWSYRNDGVDIENSADTDANSNGFNIGWTADGEWLQYTVDVDSTAAYKIELRYATPNSNSKIKFIVNGQDASESTTLPATGGYGTWKYQTIEDVVLYRGQQKIRLFIEKGGANIGFMKFSLSKQTNEIPFNALTAKTINAGGLIELGLNKQLSDAAVSPEGFTIVVNDSTAEIESITKGESNNSLLIDIQYELSDADVVKLNYASGNIEASDETDLNEFSEIIALNTLPVHYAIEGFIEAENFMTNQGLALENTTDAGGGQNIGYTNVGDFLLYRIRVKEDGNYKLEVRTASAGQAGKLKFEQLDKNDQVISTATIDVPTTGGWQTWKTINTTMEMKAGTGYLKVSIVQPEFNINWYRFTKKDEVVNGIGSQRHGSLHIYPNPADTILTIDVPEEVQKKRNRLVIRNANGVVVQRLENVKHQELKAINVSGLDAGLYVVEYESKDAKATSKLVIR